MIMISPSLLFLWVAFGVFRLPLKARDSGFPQLICCAWSGRDNWLPLKARDSGFPQLICCAWSGRDNCSEITDSGVWISPVLLMGSLALFSARDNCLPERAFMEEVVSKVGKYHRLRLRSLICFEVPDFGDFLCSFAVPGVVGMIAFMEEVVLKVVKYSQAWTQILDLVVPLKALDSGFPQFIFCAWSGRDNSLTSCTSKVMDSGVWISPVPNWSLVPFSAWDNCFPERGGLKNDASKCVGLWFVVILLRRISSVHLLCGVSRTPLNAWDSAFKEEVVLEVGIFIGLDSMFDLVSLLKSWTSVVWFGFCYLV
ncbi:uncharacterized protein G2W53_031515 [Senna tora]|uniref:Uncharacterized protein n=1 Tax=Senna tora TaxID=362788 RepID=A0A834TAR4_9FABA|nr:uncharacterized protein G2W53_031515 [Senna tora]